MVFSSLLFLYLYLPLALLLYYLLPRRWRNPVLLVLSLLFYGWGEPRWIVILLFSSVVDFVCSNIIERNRDGLPAGEKDAARRTKIRKRALVASLVLNLGVLCFFKYGAFLLENLAQISALGGAAWMQGALDFMGRYVSLPIGISFYTFQTISCTIDVYRGEARAQRNLLDFATYVALFPQLIAGPIVRYRQIAEQLTGRRETLERFAAGILTFSVGLCKKVLLANQFGALWDQVREMPAPPALTALFGLLCFSFQIYFDFSGYSDMALGLGRMFGFELPVNFHYPYTSRSITEFWRRWHMTLGMWFREYVYIPLGGNRGGTLRMLRNIFIVWFLTGLWHGASWNFVLWGLYYGVLLLLEKLVLRPLLRRYRARHRGERFLNALRHLYTMSLVVLGWGLFAITDFGELGDFFAALFGGNGWLATTPEILWDAGYTQGGTLSLTGGADPWLVYQLRGCWPLLLAGILACTPLPKELWHRISYKGEAPRLGRSIPKDLPEARFPGRCAYLSILLALLGLLLCTAFLVNASYNPFLYFRF